MYSDYEGLVFSQFSVFTEVEINCYGPFEKSFLITVQI